MDSAADRKSIRAKEKRSEILAAQRNAVVRNLMSTIEGRIWMWDTLARCHAFETSFTPDSHVTAFREGERNIGLSLMAEVMTACPDQYLQAQREANERYISDNRSTDHASERRRGEIDDGGDSGREGSDPDETRSEASRPVVDRDETGYVDYSRY